MEYVVEQLIAAIKEADECLHAHEGVNLLYYMDKRTAEYRIIADILGEKE